LRESRSLKLQTLLREAGAGGGALAGLELRVGFADHVDRALAFHDLAIGMAALGGGEGRKNFHGGKVVWMESAARANRGAKASHRTFLVKPFLARSGIFSRPGASFSSTSARIPVILVA
jgi:hypothetical protein